MVLYQFMSGLNDLDVQADLLAKPHLSLPEAEAFAIHREMAKRSQDVIHHEELSRIKSTYKRQKAASGASKAQACPGLPEAGLCTHWGEAAHANRRTQCKAFNHTCTCGRRGHFLKVCFRKGQPGTPPRAVAEAIETSPAPDLARPAQDGLFELSTKFVAEADRAFIDVLQSPQSNRLPITITVDSSSMPSVRSGSDDLRTATCTAMADTGATVTCCGPDVLANLGVARTSLLRSSISLYAANKSRLTVCVWGGGALPASLSLTSHGKSHHTVELMNAVQDLSGLYLSKDALTSLGSIPGSFPYPPPPSDQPTATADVSAVYGDSTPIRVLAPCGCPLRTDAPDPPPLPESADEADVPALKKLLLDHYASSTFNTCCHQPLPLMHGPPLELAIKPGASLHAVYTPSTVPLHWEDKIKRDLDRDIDMGVLEKVDVNEPVTWCSRMVVTRKHNGEPRRTIDLQALNEAGLRQAHPTMPPFQQAMSIPGGHWKSTTDAFNGYHSVSIRSEDRHLTTFLTPWGRYRYKTAPQGYKASGDAYTHRFDKVTVNVDCCARVIDDSILYKPTVAEMFQHMAAYLTLCGRNGILQNKDFCLL